MALIQLPNGAIVDDQGFEPPPPGPEGWYPPGQRPPPRGPAGWYQPRPQPGAGQPLNQPPAPPPRGVGPPPGGTGGLPAVQPPAGLPAAQGDPLGSSVTLSPRAPGATLNNTGPEIFPPNYRPIRPGASVGPFTGGYSTENMGGDDANWRDPVWKASEHMTEGPTGGSNLDPRNWFKPGPSFKPGEPIGGAGGGFNPLSILGVGNPYWRGAIAAGGVLSPTPAETGEFTPAEPNFVRPDAPMGGVHGLPAAPKPADDGGGKPPVEPNKARPRAKTPAPGKRAPIPAGDINLGYYSPTTGNARGATFQKYTDPNDPRIYKGPLTMYGQQ